MESTGLLISTRHSCYFKSMVVSALLAITLDASAQNSVKPELSRASGMSPPVLLP